MTNESSSDSRRAGPGERQPTAAVRVVTTADREDAVARLSAAFAGDALSLEEFERRMEAVYQAPTTGALARLVEDLPGPAGRDHTGADLTSHPSVMSPRLAVAFGSVERGGPMAVPARLDLRAVCGNLELDLREAEFGPGVTEISVYAVLGNVEIRLPAHVAIENRGDTFLGSFSARVTGEPRTGRDLSARSSARLRVTGKAVFGNVELEREPAS